MTLHTYDFEQRSPEWYDARRGVITASTVGQLITPKTVKPASNDYSRALIATLAAERITGWTEDTFVNFDMQRGIEEEPRARDWYAERYGRTVTEVGFIVREEADWKLGLSPDGLVGEDGLLEIKAPRAKTQVKTFVAGAVPIEHMAQCQAALLVTGREWLDFISWSGGLPPFVKRIRPDQQWQDAIVEAVTSAEEAITQMVNDYRAAVVGLPVTERRIEELEMTF